MNTYALSDRLTLPPEPFVSYKTGQNTKVTTDNTFLRRQISEEENIDFPGLISTRQNVHAHFFFTQTLVWWLKEFHGEIM